MRYDVKRQSNFELLRLLSMFLIVFYHLLMWFVSDNPAYDWVHAFWIPLHVGVICFVLISGYFLIRPSSRGLLLLLGILLVYSLPSIVHGIRNAESGYDILHSLQFVSNSEFWFVKTYLALYLVSPLLNTFFEHASIRGQWYLFVVLALISIYCGHFAKEASLSQGKSLVNFMLIYQTGHLLREYYSKWKALNWSLLVSCYLGLNIILVGLFLMTRGNWMGSILWKLSFPYNSPFLILNAVLLFILFGKLEFHSQPVNRLAMHCLPIYLIHGMALIVNLIERPMVNGVFRFCGENVLATLPILLVLACVIVFGCIAVDCLFIPAWKWIDRKGSKLQASLGF